MLPRKPSPSAAGPIEGVEARNKALVEASFAAWEAGRGGPFDLLAEDAVWIIEGRSVAAKSRSTCPTA